MAFVQLSNCFSQPKYLIRCVALMLCVCIASYQLSGCIIKIFHPPTTTHSSFKLNQTLKYPSLTICRNPGYKIELFAKYGLVDVSDPSVTSFWKDFNFKNYSLEQFFADTTYSQEEVVPLHGFNGQLEALDIQNVTKLTYGRCFKFSPRFLATSWRKCDGLSFYMMTQAVRVDHAPSRTRKRKPAKRWPRLLKEPNKLGFHVFIHEPNERIADNGDQSDSFMEYIYVESEQDLDYILSVTEYRNLRSADNDCTNDYNYSKSMCEEECLADVVTNKVGCSSPWLKNQDFPPCSTYEQTRDLIKTYNEFRRRDNEQCNCPRACNITIYMPHVAQQNRLDYGDQCSLAVYYASNLVTVTEEVAIYDWSLFIADLGGSLGFLLGVSVLGLISMIEQIAKMCLSLRIAKSSKKDMQDEHEQADNTKNTHADEKPKAKVLLQEDDNFVLWKEKTYFSINDLYM